jgi:hypothetical protein
LLSVFCFFAQFIGFSFLFFPVKVQENLHLAIEHSPFSGSDRYLEQVRDLAVIQLVDVTFDSFTASYARGSEAQAEQHFHGPRWGGGAFGSPVCSRILKALGIGKKRFPVQVDRARFRTVDMVQVPSFFGEFLSSVGIPSRKVQPPLL